jgi:hypothetical protein
VSLAFLLAMAHNQVVEAVLRAIAFGFLKAQVFQHLGLYALSFQVPSYNWYITISDSSSQEKSYLTYINFSNILRVWLNQRHGIGRCLNASGVSISGYLVKKLKLLESVLSVKALTGTSRARLKKVRQKRQRIMYNERLLGGDQPPLRLRGFRPIIMVVSQE